jgi:hypothetical protein
MIMKHNPFYDGLKSWSKPTGHASKGNWLLWARSFAVEVWRWQRLNQESLCDSETARQQKGMLSRTEKIGEFHLRVSRTERDL